MCKPVKNRFVSPRVATWRPLMLLLLASATLGSLQARGATVNLWLSNSDGGPEVPILNVPTGAAVDLKVWARPPANRTLIGISLNLFAQQSNAISFQAVEVHNPHFRDMRGVLRHQLVFDSNNLLDDATPAINIDADSIDGFFGITFLDGLNEFFDGRGIGPACEDQYCSTGSGDPSWHIATVTFQAGDAGTSTELFLQLGEQGIWLADEEFPTDTSARFGEPTDDLNEWSVCPNPDPEGLCVGPNPDHRGEHVGLADAVINVVSSSADFDVDGDVDGSNFLTWQQGYGSGTTFADGDANGDGQIDGDDLAVWEAQFATGVGSAEAASAIPEPASIVLLAALVLFCCRPPT